MMTEDLAYLEAKADEVLPRVKFGTAGAIQSRSMTYPTIEEIGASYNAIAEGGPLATETATLCRIVLTNPLLHGTVLRYCDQIKSGVLEIFPPEAFIAGILAAGLNHGLRIGEMRQGNPAL